MKWMVLFNYSKNRFRLNEFCINIITCNFIMSRNYFESSQDSVKSFKISEESLCDYASDI